MLRDDHSEGAEGWFFYTVLVAWISIIIVGLAITITSINKAYSAPKAKKPTKTEQSAPECVVAAPLMEKLKASGLEYEVVTDTLAVLKIVLVLKQNADKPFPTPTSLVIAFVGEEAKIGLIMGDKLCAVITGPASAVRAMLRRVHGQSVDGTA